MITRIHECAAKLLKTGATRIYAKASNALDKAGLPANTPITVRYYKHRIEITKASPEEATHKIMDTGRGALLELRNKATTESFPDVAKVCITVRRNKAVITLTYTDKLRLQREKTFLQKMANGEPLRTSSWYSGMGKLAWDIKVGLERAGVKTQIAFAIDSSEIAMECNLEGNPIWDDATDDAIAVVHGLSDLDLHMVPQSDIAELGIPCVNHSSLCKEEARDLDHKIVGTLFIKTVAALRASNPAIFTIENTPRFLKSKTFELMKRELPDYNFSETVINGHDYGDIETRKRACIVATSAGLPTIDVTRLIAPTNVVRKPLSAYLTDIPLDSHLWKEMAHVKKKSADERYNYKNKLFTPESTKIGTLTSSYAPMKAGSPMLAHPTNPNLQRQFTEEEHANIRNIPDRLFDSVSKIWLGTSQLVSKKGSKDAAHRVLGNSVSKLAWNAFGTFLGQELLSIARTAWDTPEAAYNHS